jgi:phosphatidylinositol-3-phosphatase
MRLRIRFGVLLGILAASMTVHATPQYRHVVVVVLENHTFKQVVGSPNAPFINSKLVKGGVTITNAYGEQHPSQPNYYWLFSGSNQGITTDDPPWPSSDPGPVFTTNNLWVELSDRFPEHFFLGFVDSGTPKPITDFYTDTTNYATKHVPWLGFANINNGNPSGVTRDFGTSFPKTTKEFDALPTVSFVIPALNHDMHDYNSTGDPVSNPVNSARAVRNGDRWLGLNLWKYAQWAKANESLLIVTTDEDSTVDWETPRIDDGNGVNGGVNPEGLTAWNLGFQATTDTSGPNQITMIFYGAHLNTKGLYRLPGVGVNNVNLLRTIESFYHLGRAGMQSSLALSAGMDDGPITTIFDQ